MLDITKYASEEERVRLKQEHTEKVADLYLRIKDVKSSEIKLLHSFGPGVYVREMMIPKGELLIGHTHKTEHLNMLTQGEILIAMDGKSVKMIAPYTFVSSAGSQKVGLALTDTVWATIHPTVETDLDKIEANLIDYETDEETAKLAEERHKLGLNKLMNEELCQWDGQQPQQ